MPVKNLEDLFEHTMKDLYFAENRILKALPTMVEKANSPALKRLFSAHLRETENHVERLRRAFELIGRKASGEECPAIEGIIEEAESLIGEIRDPETMDAALISAAQAVEHYEITRYGTLLTWANQLGHDKIVALLRDSIEEEKSADSKLTRLAEDSINKKAA